MLSNSACILPMSVGHATLLGIGMDPRAPCVPCGLRRGNSMPLSRAHLSNSKPRQAKAKKKKKRHRHRHKSAIMSPLLCSPAAALRSSVIVARPPHTPATRLVLVDGGTHPASLRHPQRGGPCHSIHEGVFFFFLLCSSSRGGLSRFMSD